MAEVKVDPAKMSMDMAGTVSRHWWVLLPEGMVADGIKDPSIWSRVQGNHRTTMHKHDRIYAVAFDGSFAIEARVGEATRDAAVLVKPSIISFPERVTPLFSDENYRLEWRGDGYAVIRRVDGRQMGGLQPSEALAIQHLRRQYPVPI